MVLIICYVWFKKRKICKFSIYNFYFQAFNWICENEKNLQITSFADPNHLTLLKNAFKDGGVLLFEEVGMIDPIIYNILDKKLVSK